MKKNSVLKLLIPFFLSVLSFFSFQTYADSYQILTDSIHKSDRDDRNYQIIQLENQMKILLISDQKAIKSSASLALPVGSLYDPKTQQGLAHYTEHMVLMGSKKYPTPDGFSSYLSQYGGSHNASTWGTQTAFYFEVENSAFSKALDYLADAIAEPLFDPKNADKERNAVNAEFTMRRAFDNVKIQQVNAETLNQDHPASQFFIGNLDTLSDKPNSILQDELNTFYHHYYSANIMIGVIYSNDSIDKLGKLATQTFGKIKNHNIHIEPITVPALTKKTQSKWIYLEPTQTRKTLYIKFPIDSNIQNYIEKNHEYISNLISNRTAGTLFDILKQKGLVDGAGASYNRISYGNSGEFSIGISLTDQGLKEKDTIIQAVFNYLELIKKNVKSSYYDEMKNLYEQRFRYPDINLDMDYITYLSLNMLYYPLDNVLDMDYIAPTFNKRAIEQILNSFTPSNARIWVIAPNQKTDKLSHFMDARYRIKEITQEQQAKFTQPLSKDFGQLRLPNLNPYIVTKFNVNNEKITKNQISSFSDQGNHIHFPTQYFKNEPEAVISLSLRNEKAIESAKNQVMIQLLDYLAWRDLAELNSQSSISGVSLSTTILSGITFTASGFTQHLIEILSKMINTFNDVKINESNLALAKSTYLEYLERADQVVSFQLSMQPMIQLSAENPTDRAVRRNVIKEITVDDLKQYQHELMTNSVPYMLSVGNIRYDEAEELYQLVKKKLNPLSHYHPNEKIIITDYSTALITQQTKNTDHALLMGFVPKNYDRISSKAISLLLNNIISPDFYNKLRSNEQLGYVVSTQVIQIGNNSGLGFIIQSNQYDPKYLNQRYQAFYPMALAKLKSLSNKQIEQYKNALIDEFNQPPQTLDDEYLLYYGDFCKFRFDFKSKEKMIKRIKAVTQQELIQFYQNAVMNPTGLVFGSQVLGNSSKKANGLNEGFEHYQNASILQKKLLRKKVIK